MPLCKALIVACVQRCDSILVNIGSDRVSHRRRTQHTAWRTGAALQVAPNFTHLVDGAAAGLDTQLQR